MKSDKEKLVKFSNEKPELKTIECANKKCSAKWKGHGIQGKYCSTRCHNDCEKRKIVSLDF